MNKLFKFTQAKGKWHKFPSFNLGGGAKLYKNFAQKLLAVSLCMAVVLCTVPLRGGSHVVEAAEGEGTVLHVAVAADTTSQEVTATAAWAAFDIAAVPSLSFSLSVDGSPTDWPRFALFAGDGSTMADDPFVGLSDCGELSYDVTADVVALFGPLIAPVPRCISSWSALGGLYCSFADDTPALLPAGVPSLPASLLFRSSVALASAVGSSASWKPDVEVAHCDDCAVTLVAPAGSPVAVSGTYDDGWTITRSASGAAVLDLLVGDFKVGEVTVTEVAGVADPGTDFLHDTVHVDGKPQRLRVYDPNGVLPADTTFKAEYVDGSHGDHNFFITHLDPATDVELQHFYNLTLTSAGQTLSELDGPVELWFEAIDGIDAADSFISRVAEGADAKLTPTLYTDADGVTWIKVLTDHFSPYALTDLLSDDEKATLAKENSGPKNNVKTGDLTTQITVAGLGMTLVLALGIMLRLLTIKRKFEE